MALLICYFYGMKPLVVLFFIWLNLIEVVAQPSPPIGQWREHVPFSSSFNVAPSQGSVYAAFPYGVLIYNLAKKEIIRKTKMSGLNGSRIIQFAKDLATDRIALVYSDYNIDIVDGDKIINIPDLFLKVTTADKTVNSISWFNGLLFVSSNLGIIVVDPSKREVKDTYKTGLKIPESSVNQVAFFGNEIYAATAVGLKKTSLAANWPGNISDWKLDFDEVFLPGNCLSVLNWQGNPVVRKKDSVFIKENGKWRLMYSSLTPINSISVSDNKLFITQSKDGKGVVLMFTSSSSNYQTINSPLLISPAYCASAVDGIWVADQKNGLLKISGSVTEKIQVNAPASIASGRGVYSDGQILAAAGSVSQDWKGELNQNGFFIFDGIGWNNYNAQSKLIPDSIFDIVDVVKENSTNKIYAASFGAGLIEFDNKNIKVYKQGSVIKPSISNSSSYLIGGLAVDQKQQLWVSNYGAEQGLLVKKKDNTWISFSIPFVFSGNTVGRIIVDGSNRKWIISPKGNGLFCFDDMGTVDQKNDDRWRYFQQGKGKGNLPSSNVLSIAADRNGSIWVGTDRGIGIIQCGTDIFNSTACEAILPVVRQDNFNGLLFAEESVNDIAVDGANRKWVATDNGVWLVSSDGQQVISHFNEANSNLLGDSVFQTVIHEKSGEVFFFTNNGICSYVGTATGPTENKARPIIFPNPVPSGYGGPIAIRGLNENAWVRITELDGKLVYQTRSLGGQAIWNGRNYKGVKINSGVYLVITSNEFNEQQVATKIFFIK